MHPVIEAILFLLRGAQASGNYPEGQAAAHTKAIEESMQERGDTPEPEPEPEKVTAAPEPEPEPQKESEPK